MSLILQRYVGKTGALGHPHFSHILKKRAPIYPKFSPGAVVLNGSLTIILLARNYTKPKPMLEST